MAGAHFSSFAQRRRRKEARMTTDQIAHERPLRRRMEWSQPNIAAVRSTVTDLEQKARTLVKQRPVVAVLAAFGVGYVVARLLSRGLR